MKEATITKTEEVTEVDELHLLPFNDPLLKRKPEPFDFDKHDAKEIKKTLINKMMERLKINNQMHHLIIFYCLTCWY